MKPSQSDRGALLLMALIVLIWSYTWVVLKYLSAYVSPFDLVVWRYSFGSLFLFIVLGATKQSLRFPPFWPTVGIALFQTAAFSCLSQLALIVGGTGQVVMLVYTMPFWVVLLAWPLLHERPGGRQIFGCVLAGLGLTAVIAPWEGLGGIGSSMLALAAGLCWGLGTILSKRLYQRHTPNVLAVTAWQMLLGAVMTSPFIWWEAPTATQWSFPVVLGIAYLAILSSAAGWALWLLIVRRVSAVMAGMSGLAIPVLVIFLAWLMLGERPTGLEFTGMALILVGLIVVSLSQYRRAGR